MKIDGALMAATPEASGALARELEEQGHDGVYSFEGPHDPFFPLLLAAQTTKRVELATGVAIAFARNPMICAQIAHDLQRLSSGRFILGLGTQIRPHIERRFSQSWSRPASRMREFVLAIRAIWACWRDGGKLDFRGEFYTHTLMTPMFSPGPNPFGDPRIFLAGVGSRMIEVCGEVADGFFVHPLHTPSYLREIALPALERGLAAGGRERDRLEVCCQTIVCIGSNDEEIARARNKARAQLSFYGSTPAYGGVLEHAGHDDLLDEVVVSGTPSGAGARLRERNGALVERSGLGLYNETEPDAVVDLIRASR